MIRSWRVGVGTFFAVLIIIPVMFVWMALADISHIVPIIALLIAATIALVFWGPTLIFLKDGKRELEVATWTVIMMSIVFSAGSYYSIPVVIGMGITAALGYRESNLISDLI
jgi:hypothetical protein